MEEWKWPLVLGSYVPCYPCGRLFLVLDDGVEPVVLSFEPPELQRAFDDMLASWFELERRRQELVPHQQRVAA